MSILSQGLKFKMDHSENREVEEEEEIRSKGGEQMGIMLTLGNWCRRLAGKTEEIKTIE